MTATGPNDLCLASVFQSISTSRDAWVAFATFADKVMRAKEEAERVREAARNSPDPFDPG